MLSRWLKLALWQAYVSRGLEVPEGFSAPSNTANVAIFLVRAGANPGQICRPAT